MNKHDDGEKSHDFYTKAYMYDVVNDKYRLSLIWSARMCDYTNMIKHEVLSHINYM